MPNLLLQNPSDVGYDIVLALGQSNMSGYSPGVDAARLDTSDSRVHQFAASGTYANQISLAVDPLGHPDAPTGLGPALHFARWYALAKPTNRRVLVVPAARGGTPFEGTSSGPGYTWKVGRTDVTNLYENAIALATAALGAAGANARIVAAIWVQGESDGDNATPAATYKADLDALIAGLRARLNVPTLPFIIGGIVPEYCTTGARNVIHLAHVDSPNRNANCGYAWGSWGTVNGDGNHYNATGQRIMARRLFAAYQRVVSGQGQDAAPAPTPIAISATAGDGQVAIAGSGGLGYGATIALYRGSTAMGTPIATALPFTDTGRANGTAVSYVATSTTAGGTVTSQVATVTPSTAGGSSSTGTVVSDTFTRADSTSAIGTADTGQTWTAAYGTWGIASNQAYSVTGTDDNIAVIDSGKTDVTVSAVVRGATTNSNVSLIARYTDLSNYYLVNVSGPGARIFKKVAGGAYTQVGSVSGAITFTDGDVFTLSAIGTTLTAKQNGTVLVTTTDASLTTGTRVGLRIGGTTSASVRYDNFTATAVGATDTYTRADSTSTLGSTEGGSYPYSVASTGGATGTYGISGNAAYTPTNTGETVAYFDDGLADSTYSATVANSVNGSTGIVTRMTDTANFLLVYRVADKWTLASKSAGTFTTVATATGSAVAGDVVSIDARATAIVVKVNGVTAITGTVTANQTGTKKGFWAAGSTASKWDTIQTVA